MIFFFFEIGDLIRAQRQERLEKVFFLFRQRGDRKSSSEKFLFCFFFSKTYRDLEPRDLNWRHRGSRLVHPFLCVARCTYFTVIEFPTNRIPSPHAAQRGAKAIQYEFLTSIRGESSTAKSIFFFCSYAKALKKFARKCDSATSYLCFFFSTRYIERKSG